MTTLFGAIGFISPWVLLGLLALPIIWWLLRTIPPAPRIQKFPALALLLGLEPKENTSDRTPWWLLALRLLATALVIVGLAGPLYAPEEAPSNRPLLLMVDNDWSAAAGWQKRLDQMNAIFTNAARTSKNITVVTTAAAPESATAEALIVGPTTVAAARDHALSLQPWPWPSNLERTIEALTSLGDLEDYEVVWLGNGLEQVGKSGVVSEVNRASSAQLYLEPAETSALMAYPTNSSERLFKVNVLRANPEGRRTETLVASDIEGRIVTEAALTFEAGEKQVEAAFDLPREVRNRIYRLHVDGHSNVASTWLFDSRWQRRSIGVLGTDAAEQASRLLSSTHYIQTALADFADVEIAQLDALLEKERTIIFWPDEQLLNTTNREMLEGWIDGGGTLVRFAGPNLASGLLTNRAQENRLSPVRLRPGDRSIGGAMDWNRPLELTEFTDHAPFSDLSRPGNNTGSNAGVNMRDVLVKRQILAEPSADLDAATWALLEDGTPLITMRQQGSGRLVLVHTTAEPSWSTMAISPLFSGLLERLVLSSETAAAPVQGTEQRAAIAVLDGFGKERPPASWSLSASAEAIAEQQVSTGLSPGLYGTSEERVALNFGSATRELSPFDAASFDGTIEAYEPSKQRNLAGWLLAAAFVLLLIDFLVRMLMNGRFSFGQRARSAPALAVLAFFAIAAVSTPQASAQSTDAKPISDKELLSISATRLAYLRSSDARVDATSRAGLFGLSQWIQKRSSIELGSPVGLSLSKDNLAFYPLIYWPVLAGQNPLPEELVKKVNDYLAVGGMLLIDSRDAGMGADSGGNQTIIRALRGVNVPPLAPVQGEHVLTKSFYLLDWFPGRWADGTIWAAASRSSDQARVNDGVSPVVLGNSDWAGAWAVDDDFKPLFPVVPGLDRQREFAYRFGMNLVMYALAGNYKADQVHVPAILQRLGQENLNDAPEGTGHRTIEELLRGFQQGRDR